jgi:D-proline reductase (dithiol) PrdB
VHLPDQLRFDIDDPSGDCSYREIPAGAADLTWTHAYYRPDEGTDLDSVFSLWTLRELEREGVVGKLGPRHFSFMGAIHDPEPLVRETAPEVAGTLAMENEVEAPRVARVPFPYNFPMGEPGDRGRHREVALAALALLQELEEPGEVALPFAWRG